MQSEIKETYIEMINDLNSEGFERGMYFETDDYEDNYSHNEIDEARQELYNRIVTYLRNNRPSQIVVIDELWCISMLSLDYSQKRGDHNFRERWLVTKDTVVDY